MRIRPRSLVGHILASLILFTPVPARSQLLRDQLWVTDGLVRAVAYWNNTAFLGGNFTSVGPALGGLAAFDTTSGTAITPSFGVAGEVLAVTPDGTGGYYVGGIFSAIKGVFRTNAAHLDASGNVTSWDPSPNDAVRAIAANGSSVFIGGSFTKIGNQNQAYMAQVDAITGALTSWNTAPDGPVYALRINTGLNYLYVGGAFPGVHGIPRGSGAAFLLSSGGLLPWDPGANGGPIEAIEIGEGETVLLGGAFFLNFGPPLLAAVDPVTGGFLGGTPSVAGNAVHAIKVTRQTISPFKTTIWFGGEFTQVNGQPRANLAAYDGALTGFNPGANGAVRSLLVTTDPTTGNASSIYAAGNFFNIGGASRGFLAALSPAGQATSWDPRPNNVVRTLSAAGAGTILAGGSLTSAAMVPRSCLAALDATSGAVTPWDPLVNNQVFSLLVHGNSLYMGGYFTQVAGQSRSYAAEVNLSTKSVTAWNPAISCLVGGCPSVVNVIARPPSGNMVYLGGAFQVVGGESRLSLAAVDTLMGDVLPFDAGLDGGWVNALEVRQRDVAPFDIVSLYVGGPFQTANRALYGNGPNGVPRAGVAEVYPATGQVTAWNPANPSLPARVYALRYVPGVPAGSGTVCVGGQFTFMGGVDWVDFAMVDATTGHLQPWSPRLNLEIPDAEVDALLLRSGSVYIGGRGLDFAQHGLLKADVNTGFVSFWNPNVPSYVLALDANGSTIYAGGSFPGAANYPHPYFAGISDGTVTGVIPSDVPPAPETVVRASPNPFSRKTEIRFRLPRPQLARVTVHDASGRLVRELFRGVLGEGEQVLGWDGRDQGERPAATGIYFVRVDTPSVKGTTKLLFQR